MAGASLAGLCNATARYDYVLGVRAIDAYILAVAAIYHFRGLVPRHLDIPLGQTREPGAAEAGQRDLCAGRQSASV